MNITLQWFDRSRVSVSLYQWAQQEFQGHTTLDSSVVINDLISDDRLDDANFIVVRLLTQSNKIRYALFGAEMCVNNFNSVIPNNNAPIESIKAIREYLANPTTDNAYKASIAANHSHYAGTIAKAGDSQNSHNVIDVNDEDAIKSVISDYSFRSAMNAANACESASNACTATVYPAEDYSFDNHDFTANYLDEVYSFSTLSNACMAYVNAIKNSLGYHQANLNYQTEYDNSKLSLINYGISLLANITVPTHFTVEQADVNLRTVIMGWDDNSDNEVGFSIRVTSDVGYSETISVPSNTTSYTLQLGNSAVDGNYSFSAAAFDGLNYSDYCTPVTLSLKLEPPSLQAPVLSASIAPVFNGLSKAIEPLSWTIPEGAIRVDIYSTISDRININPVWNLAYKIIPPVNTVHYAFTNRYSPVSFQIRAKAIYPNGESGWSNVLTVSGHSMFDAVIE